MTTPGNFVLWVALALGCQGTAPMPSDEPGTEVDLPALEFSATPSTFKTIHNVNPAVYMKFSVPATAPNQLELALEPVVEGMEVSVVGTDPELDNALEVEITIGESAPLGEHVLSLVAAAPGYQTASRPVTVLIVAQ